MSAALEAVARWRVFGDLNVFCDLSPGRVAHQLVQIRYEKISILTAAEFFWVPQSLQHRVERLNPDTQTGPISPQCI